MDGGIEGHKEPREKLERLLRRSAVGVQIETHKKSPPLTVLPEFSVAPRQIRRSLAKRFQV